MSLLQKQLGGFSSKIQKIVTQSGLAPQTQKMFVKFNFLVKLYAKTVPGIFVVQLFKKYPIIFEIRIYTTGHGRKRKNNYAVMPCRPNRQLFLLCR